MEEAMDLDELWKNACVNFERVSGKHVKQDQKTDLDEVIQQLEKNFGLLDEKTRNENQKLRSAGKQVLQLLKLLGGIAAQGASIVFGPANLCFNAVSILIDLPLRISDLAANLRALFEHIQTSLLQLQIYRDIEKFTAIDPALLKTTNTVMISFTEICAMAIKFFSGSRFRDLLKRVKIAILDDGSDVKQKLEEFRNLTLQQSNVSNAISLKNILEGRNENQSLHKRLYNALGQMADDTKETRSVGEVTYTIVATMQKEATEKNSKTNDREDVKVICEKLLGKSDTDRPPKKLELTLSEYSHLGSWVEDTEAYKEWADLEKSVSPVLLISGPSGSGKSSLAFAIAERLCRPSSESASPTKLSTAFYQFPKPAKKERREALQDAIKSIAAQLSECNVVVRKRLRKTIESNDSHLLRNTDVSDMLKEMLSACEDRDESRMSFIIVFDAIEQLSPGQQEALYQAVSKQDSAPVRFILTGDTDTDTLLDNYEGDSFSARRIQMGEHNEEDIRDFVKRSLAGPRFLEEETPETKEYIEKIQEQLPSNVDGSFLETKARMDSILDAIHEGRLENIDAFLDEDTSKLKSQRINMLLERLSRDLNGIEIEQVNEILACVLYADEWLSVKDMEAFFSLQDDRPLRKNLKSKITGNHGRYRRLLTLDDGYIKLNNIDSDQLEKMFPKRRVSAATIGISDEPTISMDIRIHHATRPQLQRFFWDLSRQTTLAHWPATSVSVDSQDDTPAISANIVDGHLLITRRCLDLLQITEGGETSCLNDYASGALFSHLSTLMEYIGDLQAAEKLSVMEELISMLQFPGITTDHLDEDFLDNGKWLEDDDIETMQGWLGLHDIALTLKPRSQRWLREVLSEDRLLPFRKLCGVIAREWLCSRKFEAKNAYHWVRKYISQSKSTIRCGEKAWEDEMENGESVTFCASWAVNTFKIGQNSLYHQRLAETFEWLDETDLHFKSLSDARIFHDHDWTVLAELSDVYSNRQENDLAAQTIKEAFAEARQRKNMTDTEQERFRDELVRNARWFMNDFGSMSDAESLLQESLPILDGKDYEGYLLMIELLMKTQRITETLDFVHKMSTEPSKVEGQEHLTKLSSMLIEQSDLDNLETLEELFYLSKDHEVSQALAVAFQTILDSGEDEYNLPGVHLTSGLAMALSGDLPAAVTHWEASFDAGTGVDKHSVRQVAFWAAGLCFTFYTHKALALAQDCELDPDGVKFMQEIEKLAVNPDDNLELRPVIYLLASFHASKGDQAKARSLLMADFRAGLTLLSDDTDENDDEGYAQIAKVLMHTNDYANALSAWYLCFLCDFEDVQKSGEEDKDHQDKEQEQTDQLEPETDAPKFSGDLPYWCDGAACKRKQRWDEGIWFCTVCHGTYMAVNLCDECRTMHQNNTLPRYICSPDHKMIHLSFLEEHKATKEDCVRIGGEILDGKRVGGEFIKRDQWLDKVREDWGVEKIKLDEDSEDEDDDEDGDSEDEDEDEDKHEDGDGDADGEDKDEDEDKNGDENEVRNGNGVQTEDEKGGDDGDEDDIIGQYFQDEELPTNIDNDKSGYCAELWLP